MYSVYNSLRTSEFYRDGYGGFKPRKEDEKEEADEKRDGESDE